MLRKNKLGVAICFCLSAFAVNSYASFDPKPFEKSINSVIDDNLEQPYKSAYKLAVGIFGSLLPKPEDKYQDALNKITNQLDAIQQELDVVLQIDQATLNAVNQLNEEYTSNQFAQLYTKQNQVNKTIDQKYQTLYGDKQNKGVLPANIDQYYEFAASLCQPGTCSSSEAHQVKLLDGDPPVSNQNNLTDDIALGSTSSINGLRDDFISSLSISGDHNDWTNLQDSYEQFNKAISSNGNIIARYISSTKPLVDLKVSYYQSMMMLYNMEAFQLAMYYAHPDFFKTDGKINPNFNPFVTDIDGTGQEGYEQALAALTDKYRSVFVGDQNLLGQVFGGMGLTSDYKIGGADIPGVISYKSLDAYIQNIFPSLFNQKFLEDCQVTGAIFNINAELEANALNIGQVKSICKVTNEGQAKMSSVMGISVPYSIGSDQKINVGLSDISLDKQGDYYYLDATVTANEFSTNMYMKGAKFSSQKNNPVTIGGNPVYVSNCSGGSGGKCNITYQKIGLDYVSIDLLGAVNTQSTTARLTCVRSNQADNSDTSSKCYNEKLGINGSINYGHQTYYDHNHTNSGSDNAYTYSMTLSGNIFLTKIAFPGVNGRNEVNGTKSNTAQATQDIMIGCIDGDVTCSATSDHIQFSNGAIVTGLKTTIEVIKPKEWSDSLNEYAFSVDESVKPKQFIFEEPNGYQDWLNNPLGEDGSKYTTYGFAQNFMHKDPDTLDMVFLEDEQVLMTSKNENYRLIYTGKRNIDDESYILVIQNKTPSGWIDMEDRNILDYKDALGSNTYHAVSSVKYEYGNLIIKGYRLSDKYTNQISDSVAAQYKQHGFQWVADPFAELILQNDGNLVIHSSNELDHTGNQLGLGSKQILWAANWLDLVKEGDNIWNKVKNPKLTLPSTSDHLVDAIQ